MAQLSAHLLNAILGGKVLESIVAFLDEIYHLLLFCIFRPVDGAEMAMVVLMDALKEMSGAVCPCWLLRTRECIFSVQETYC